MDVPSGRESKVKVEVKSSSIPNAGRGVFVTQDIKKGEIVCYYEGYEVDKNKLLSVQETDFMLARADSKFVIGFSEPKTADGVAQLINDAAKPDFSKFPEGETILNRLKWLECCTREYMKESLAKTNVMPSLGQNRNSVSMLRPASEETHTSKDRWEFLALRDLKAGEELFLCYTANHWLECQYQTAAGKLALAITYFHMLLEISRQHNETIYDKSKTLAIKNNLDLYQCSMEFTQATHWLLELNLETYFSILPKITKIPQDRRKRIQFLAS